MGLGCPGDGYGPGRNWGHIYSLCNVARARARTQVRLRCFQQEVIVVGHQDVRMNPDSEAFDQCWEQFDKMSVIPLIGEDGASLNAAAGDMIPCPWTFDAWRSRHAGENRQNQAPGQPSNA